MTINYKKIGAAIKKFRLAQSLSQEELAEYCNLSPSYISYIETGKRRISFKKLEEISQFLNFSMQIIPQQEKDNILNFLHNCTESEKKILILLIDKIRNELEG